jgi:hypothetical protein
MQTVNLERTPCRVSRAWYRERTTRKVDAHMHTVHSGWTGITTLVIQDGDGRKMQLELDPVARAALVAVLQAVAQERAEVMA